MHISAAWELLLFSIGAAASVIPFHPISLHDVWQFPNGTWAENLAVRSNGQLLVTFLSQPELYQVDPLGKTPPNLVYSFPDALGLLGISEVEHDVFAVVVGNWSTKTLENIPGSYALWTVDLSSAKPNPSGPSAPNVSKVTDIPAGVFLNGLTTLDKTAGSVLVGDAGAGTVYRVDTHSGEYLLVLDDSLMGPNPIPALQLGINGIHKRGNFLYWANSSQGLFARIPIHTNGTAAGPAEIVAQNGLGDDFAFDPAGNAYLGQNTRNTLQKITPEGVTSIIAGNLNSSTLPGPTAAQFGRTAEDRSVLYVTTSGGIAAPINGTYVEGGRVVAVTFA